MKVLHTIDPDGRGCSTYTAALLADFVGATPEVEHEVLVVGSAADAEFVRDLGLDGVTRVPRRPRWLRWPAARPRQARPAAGVFDIVHAWEVASAAHAGGAALVTTMHAPDVVGPPAVFGDDGTLLLASREPVTAAWRDAGFGAGRCRTMRPGVDPARVQRGLRAALRSAWGVRDDDVLVGILGNLPGGIDTWNAVTLQSLLDNTHRSVRIALPGGGRNIAEAGRWARTLEISDRVIRDAGVDEPWRIADALDAVFVVGGSGGSRGGGLLPILWAMSAGLAVLAERGGGAESVIEHGRNGLLVDSGRTDRACHNLVRLHDDPAMRRVLGEAARKSVDEHHRAGAFARQVLDVYAEIGGAGVRSVAARSERAGHAPHRDTASGASVPADVFR